MKFAQFVWSEWLFLGVGLFGLELLEHSKLVKYSVDSEGKQGSYHRY